MDGLAPTFTFSVLSLCFALTARAGTLAANSAGGWMAVSPREEIRPRFNFEPKGGPDGSGSWVIEADHREGLEGYWTKTLPVSGGRYYHFSILRKAVGTDSPRRTAVVQIFWFNAKGEPVRYGEPGSI